MKKITEYEAHIDDLKDMHWLCRTTKDGDIEFLDSDESIARAATQWKMTPEAVTEIRDAFDYLIETLVDLLRKDLKEMLD